MVAGLLSQTPRGPVESLTPAPAKRCLTLGLSGAHLPGESDTARGVAVTQIPARISNIHRPGRGGEGCARGFDDFDVPRVDDDVTGGRAPPMIGRDLIAAGDSDHGQLAVPSTTQLKKIGSTEESCQPDPNIGQAPYGSARCAAAA